MPGGSAVATALPRGENGRALCRWCALEVPKGRLTFCSEWCVHEWRMRTDAGYLRQLVLKRDKGVCSLCRVNTLSAFLRMKKARGTSRDEMLVKFVGRGPHSSCSGRWRRMRSAQLADALPSLSSAGYFGAAYAPVIAPPGQAGRARGRLVRPGTPESLARNG
jgi:hypothetical protein